MLPHAFLLGARMLRADEVIICVFKNHRQMWRCWLPVQWSLAFLSVFPVCPLTAGVKEADFVNEKEESSSSSQGPVCVTELVLHHKNVAP